MPPVPVDPQKQVYSLELKYRRMYPIFVSFSMLPIIYESVPSQLILMKDLTPQRIHRQMDAVNQRQLMLIKKMNLKFLNQITSL